MRLVVALIVTALPLAYYLQVPGGTKEQLKLVAIQEAVVVVQLVLTLLVAWVVAVAAALLALLSLAVVATVTRVVVAMAQVRVAVTVRA